MLPRVMDGRSLEGMRGRALAIAAAGLLAACSGGEAPAAPVAPSSAAHAPVASAPVSLPNPTAAASAAGAGSAPAGSTSASASAPVATEPVEEPPLIGPDGKPLPQTDDTPSATSPLFRRHMELLFRAIAADDPAIAEPVFFPRVAYEQVKDIAKPAADWKHRLMKAFVRDIHEYHGKLGDEPDKAVFLGIDVPEDKAKWMKRGSEGNKLGYFRVKRAKLRFRSAAGKESELEITSCISWRGEWYVVHLHGFK